MLFFVWWKLKKVCIFTKNNNKTMNLKDTLDRLFDKDLALTHEQRDKLITIIGDHSKHEWSAGFQQAKQPI